MRTTHAPSCLDFLTFRRVKSLAVLASLFLGLGTGAVTAATVIWTHAGEDWNWNNRTNWSTFTVPTAGDDVFITNSASFTVNIDAYGDFGFNSLTVGGTSGTITMTWNPSWLKGAITLGPGTVMNIVGSYSGHFLSGVITNYGVINWQAGGWQLVGRSRVENMPGGVVDITCDTMMNSDDWGTVNNAGTFRKSTGGGNEEKTVIAPAYNIAFNNSGVLEVLGGRMEMGSTGTNSGTVHIASGTVLAYNDGPNVFGPTHTFTGTGFCDLGGTFCEIAGTLKGTVTFRLVYDLTLNAELASGTMVWNYAPGNQFGNLVVGPSAVFSVGSGSIISGTITNYGLIVWPPDGGTTWRWEPGSRLENGAGAVINLQKDARFYAGVGSRTLNNAGTVRKSGGTDRFLIDPGFVLTNTGVITVQTGSLALNDLTSSSTVTVAAGATVDLITGTFNFLPGHVFSGTGTWRLIPFIDPISVNGPLNGTPKYAVDGPVTFNSRLDAPMWWTNGTLAGNLTIGTNAVVNFVNGNTFSGTVTNHGRINWLPGSSPWVWYEGARLENRSGGVIDFQSDFGFALPTNTVWNNAGTILKSGGLGDSHLYTRLALTNSGLLDFQKGHCALGDGLNSTGTIGIAAGASVGLDAGSFVFGPGHTFTGVGALNIGASLLTVEGPLAGTVAFKMVYDTLFTNCVLRGTMEWNSGNLAGDLTVGSSGLLKLMNAGELMGVVTNYGQISWPADGAISWRWEPGGALHNEAEAVFHVDTTNSRSFYAGTTDPRAFYNQGTFRKTGVGTLQFYPAFTFANQGVVEALGGVLHFGGAFTQDSGLTRLAGGSLQPDKGMNLAGGLLTGSGTVNGSVTNMAALVGPGEPLGAIYVTGDYLQGAGGTFDVTIGGRDAEEFDVLTVGGSATLNGTLVVGFTNGFPPAIGDQFQVVSCASRSGVFSVTNAPSGLAPAYSNNAVYLDVTANIPVSSMLTSVEMSGGNFGFSFLTANGQSYSVLTNRQVNGTGWGVYTNFNGNGSTVQILAPPNMPQCFFQVRQP